MDRKMKPLTKYQCACKTCGKIRTFSEIVRKSNRDSNCKECSIKLRTKEKGRFKRECSICKSIKIRDYHIKSDICACCSRKKLGSNLANIKYSKPYKASLKYIYFCPHCESVRSISKRRKSPLCSICSKLYARRKVKCNYKFDFDSMSMISTIKEDANTKGKSKTATATKASKNARKSSYKNDEISTLMKMRIEKEKEKNRNHRENSSKIVKQDMKSKRERDAIERNMIDDFLKNKKVTKLEDNITSSNF